MSKPYNNSCNHAATWTKNTFKTSAMGEYEDSSTGGSVDFVYFMQTILS